MQPQTNLEQQLKHKISQQGAITLNEFMKIALFDPHQGYYTNKTVFGVEGDFITAFLKSAKCLASWSLYGR